MRWRGGSGWSGKTWGHTLADDDAEAGVLEEVGAEVVAGVDGGEVPGADEAAAHDHRVLVVGRQEPLPAWLRVGGGGAGQGGWWGL